MMKPSSLTLLGLVAAASAEKFQYWSGNRCTGNVVARDTLACGANRLPVFGGIHSIDLIDANGFITGFYDSRDCTGTPWFTDYGKGGCVTDASARTNCIYVSCYDHLQKTAQ
ncbi:hypothetical protein H634G_04180 [Metarhizium anisopliae BRIP 53293]|uniref:Cyanovirin-N domain-containing protein n=1 Tax=Metarhizium anisopliae BRIP 53293 TaxID=1291518 RepID=A0A0D9P1F1_METAN|nr:hypothetical protein H634G_04180 [Metarhizium anisopliae BRIP 53293]KJK95944.1 hypothetical protein H633G_00293 [Metarhizium anisopliae BRIP 53284]